MGCPLIGEEDSGHPPSQGDWPALRQAGPGMPPLCEATQASRSSAGHPQRFAILFVKAAAQKPRPCTRTASMRAEITIKKPHSVKKRQVDDVELLPLVGA